MTLHDMQANIGKLVCLGNVIKIQSDEYTHACQYKVINGRTWTLELEMYFATPLHRHACAHAKSAKSYTFPSL